MYSCADIKAGTPHVCRVILTSLTEWLRLVHSCVSFIHSFVCRVVKILDLLSNVSKPGGLTRGLIHSFS